MSARQLLRYGTKAAQAARELNTSNPERPSYGRSPPPLSIPTGQEYVYPVHHSRPTSGQDWATRNGDQIETVINAVPAPLTAPGQTMVLSTTDNRTWLHRLYRPTLPSGVLSRRSTLLP